MFLINSRFPLVSAAPTPSHQHVVLKVRAPLLPKLRGHFAEFLNHDSLDRLSILYLTTCVGFGYGRLEPHADAFLGSIGSPDHPHGGRPSGLRHTTGGFTYRQPYTLRPGRFHCLARLPSCVTPVNALASSVQVPRSTPHALLKEQSRGCFGRLVSPNQHGRSFTGTGISTRCPSTTPVGLALGPDSPRED